MAERNHLGEIRAAGGIVTRSGGAELLVVHRPKWNDWSLPKGKARHGESDESCALREVSEETGLRCDLVGYAGGYRYRDNAGRRKVVRFWFMTPVSLTERSAEVDSMVWLRWADAIATVDRNIERAFLQEVQRFDTTEPSMFEPVHLGDRRSGWDALGDRSEEGDGDGART